jgi:hypothetical protein
VAAADHAGKVKMIVLDACRNNPFQARMLQRQGRRAVGRGLAPVSPATGMLVAYAARAGTVADDGPAGGNSPFTTAFLKFVEQPRVEVRLMLGRVRDEVVRATGRQEPFTYGSLGGDEIFLNSVAPQVTTTAPPPLPSPQLSEAARNRDQIEALSDPSVFEAFRRQYGKDNPFYDQLAQNRIATLKRAEQQKLAAAPTLEYASQIQSWIEHYIEWEFLQDREQFGSRVDYYNSGIVDRDFILKEKRKYAAKWPVRRYSLVPGSLTITSRAASGYIVTFDYTYSLANGTKRLNGNGRTEVRLQQIGEKFLVVGVKEKLTTR